jgi:16S rRNA (guanine1207-N2)-methyltransferase
MTLWRSDPDRAADRLILLSLAALRDTYGLIPPQSVLLINQTATLPEDLDRAGFAVTVWNRRLTSIHGAATEPAAGSFDAALIRLPKSKDELAMLAHQTAVLLRADGHLIIYGGNDEGIKSIARRLEGLSSTIVTVSTRGHGRVLAIKRSHVNAARSTVDDWRQVQTLSCDHNPGQPWVTYPGLFADGALDPGSALLLAHLPALKPGAAVLDYGCGTGPIARNILDRDASARVDMLDNDALALMAASENVPGSRAAVLGCNLSATAGRRYDLIVSNPPIHSGIREDHAALHRLIATAPTHLTADGALVLVVQRRIPLDAVLAKAFGTVATLADDGRFRVWLARA